VYGILKEINGFNSFVASVPCLQGHSQWTLKKKNKAFKWTLLTKRRTVWQAKYIEVDTPNFISKWTKFGILLYSRKQRVKSKANSGQTLRVPGG
jgi:hypothetical protein